MTIEDELQSAERALLKAAERRRRIKKLARARKLKLERQDREVSRKAETKWLILLGRILAKWMRRDPRLKAKVQEAAAAFCIEDEDRASFDLEPLPTDDKEKRRAARRLKRDEYAASEEDRSGGDKGGNKARPARSEGGTGQGRQAAPKQQGAAAAPPASKAPAQSRVNGASTTPEQARG